MTLTDDAAIARQVDRLLERFDQITAAGRYRMTLCGDSVSDIADFVGHRETERALIAERLRREITNAQ